MTRDDRKKSPFPNHRGLATWGQRLVPLEEFRRAAAGEGRQLGESERRAAVRDHRAAPVDPTPVEGPFGRVAVFGGVYSNHRALEALVSYAWPGNVRELENAIERAVVMASGVHIEADHLPAAVVPTQSLDQAPVIPGSTPRRSASCRRPSCPAQGTGRAPARGRVRLPP